MWKFSLREVYLVTTVLGVALAVNVWNHRELRARLKKSQAHLTEVKGYATQLRFNLHLASRESVRVHRQIDGWFTSGELKLLPPTPQCHCCEGSPDWTILEIPPPESN